MTDNRYNQTLHGKIETSFSAGEEVHVLTQDAHDSRIMNIYRVAPNRTGHVGYTKKGFYLTEDEALELRDMLNKLLREENMSEMFDKKDKKMKPVSNKLEVKE